MRGCAARPPSGSFGAFVRRRRRPEPEPVRPRCSGPASFGASKLPGACQHPPSGLRPPRAPGPAWIWPAGPAAREEEHSEPLSPQPQPERKAGRGSPRCWALGDDAAPAGRFSMAGEGREGRDTPAGGSGRPTQSLAISPPPHTAALRRPICSFLCRRAPRGTSASIRPPPCPGKQLRGHALPGTPLHKPGNRGYGSPVQGDV